MRNKVKIFTAILLAVIMIFSVTACSQKNDDTDYVPEVNPYPDEESNDNINVNLYYGYKNEQFLVYETREISVPINEVAENSICAELIEGSQSQDSDFTQVINPDTGIVDIAKEGNYIFITLSNEFLQAPEGFENSDMKENIRRYLAVYSIVNTVVEYGGYEKVQILIDRDGTGSGTPLTGTEAGTGGTEVFDPRGRNGAIVLDARNTVGEILSAVEMKDFNRLYNFVAYKNSDGSDKPISDEFKSVMSSNKATVSNTEIINTATTVELDKAMVFVNMDIKFGDAEALTKTSVPISLVRENNIWKIRYDDLMSLLTE